MTKEKDLLDVLNYVGDVVIVLGADGKPLWSHPDPARYMEHAFDDHLPGLRAWYGLNKLGTPHRPNGDYTFILTRPGPEPRGLFERNCEVSDEVLARVLAAIHRAVTEDYSAWGRATFTKPFSDVRQEIELAADSHRLGINFTPKCKIYEYEGVWGYSS